MTEAKKEAAAKAETKHAEKPAKVEHADTKEHAAKEHVPAKVETKAAKPAEHKVEKAEKKAKKEEKVDIVSENVYIIPLRQVYRTNPRYRRSSKAAKMIVAYLQRHTKSEDVRIDAKLNEHIWARGDTKPPRKVQVKALKDAKGKVVASLVK